jgi:hypothetical protein
MTGSAGSNANEKGVPDNSVGQAGACDVGDDAGPGRGFLDAPTGAALVKPTIHAAHSGVCGGARSRKRATEMRSMKCIAPP